MSELGIERWTLHVSSAILRGAENSQGSPWLEGIPQADHTRMQEALDCLVRGDSELFEVEHRVMRNGGEPKWVLSRGKTSERDENGHPSRVEGVSVDIHRSKHEAIQLSDSHRKLRYHLDNTPVATIEWDAAFRVVAWSPSAEQRFGWKAEEVIGRKPSEWRFVYEEDLEAVRKAMASLTDGVTRRGVCLNRNYTKNGDVLHTEWYSSVFWDESSAQLSILSRALDVTDREKALQNLRQSEDEMRKLADAIPHMVWTTSPDGRATFGNYQWSVYTGRSAADAWTEVIHPDDRDDMLQQWQLSVQTHQQFEHEARYRRKDGEYRWHLVRANPIEGEAGVILRWVGTSTDIHELHLVQGQLQQRTAELSRSNEALRQLAYAAAHDLQEPIRTTSSFATLLATRCQAQLDDRGREYLGFIMEGSERMRNLVQSLLSYAQDSSASLTIKPVDMTTVLQSAMDNLKTRIEEAGASVQWGSLPQVSGDSTQLVRLMQNLLVNAINYGHPDRSPEIHVSAEQRGSYQAVEVRDNGIGIEEQHREEIFGLFKRVHTEGLRGSGIGLATCRQVVERHGGKIWVESVPGRGSSFFFILSEVSSVATIRA